MKNGYKLLLLLLVIVPINALALNLTFDVYKSLDVEHSYVVGEYVFNLDYGFTPVLKDFMHASRSIPEGEETTLYEAQYFAAYDYFSFMNVYTLDEYDETNMPIVNVKYLCSKSISDENVDCDLIS